MSLVNNSASISLDELVALNEEMAALVRAGVPLDAGMADLGGDLPGKLGVLATQIKPETLSGCIKAACIATMPPNDHPNHMALAGAMDITCSHKYSTL